MAKAISFSMTSNVLCILVRIITEHTKFWSDWDQTALLQEQSGVRYLFAIRYSSTLPPYVVFIRASATLFIDA